MRQERGRSRRHIDAPITAHGRMPGVAHQLKLIVVVAQQLAEVVGELFAAPVSREEVLAVRLGELRGHEQGLVVLQGRVQFRSKRLIRNASPYSGGGQPRYRGDNPVSHNLVPISSLVAVSREKV